ncbi:hypothetical protein ACVWZL_006432 [Bradyrhizobium sp. GM2.4]
MSAPMRASQNEDTDCFTVTAEEPLALAFVAQFSPSLAAACARFLAAMMSLSVPASIASWPQSSLSTSMPLSTSGSLTSGASAASASSSGAAAGPGEKGGMICAETVSTDPKIKAAASIGSLVQPNPVANSIVLPVSPVPAEDAEPSLRNCGGSIRREPTGRAKGARPMTSFSTIASAGLEARTRRGVLSHRSRSAGPVGVPFSRRWSSSADEWRGQVPARPDQTCRSARACW